MYKSRKSLRPAMAPVLETVSLRKVYGGTVALDAVDLPRGGG